MRVDIDKTKALILALIVLVIAGPIAFWNLQALDKRNEFVAALRAGQVTQFPPYLQDKQWSERDLATAKAKKLLQFRYHRGAISEVVYTLGERTLPATQYSYQAALVDTATGMKYLFGRTRGEPARWMWAGIHADSHDQWIQQRAREVEALEGKYYDEEAINAMRHSPPSSDGRSP